MHLFRFLREGPVGKKDVSFRTSGLFSNNSKTVLNGKHSWVSRKESLHLGRIWGVNVQSIMALPCSEQPLALWSHSPLSSRHKGTQVSVLIPSAVTHQEPSWVPGVVLRPGSQKGGWAFPPGAYSPRGRYTNRLPWNWCHLEGRSDGQCGPRKGTAHAISGRGIDPDCSSGGEGWGNQENLTWNTAEDWLPLHARAEHTQGSRPGFLSPGYSWQKELQPQPCVVGGWASRLARLCFSGVPSPVWCIQLWWKIREEPVKKLKGWKEQYLKWSHSCASCFFKKVNGNDCLR